MLAMLSHVSGVIICGGFHSHGGTPIARWFILWKMHPKNMDDLEVAR